MPFISRNKYMDRDGDIHKYKDIPEFGTRGGRTAHTVISGSQARLDARIAKKKHDRAMREQREKKRKAQEALRKREAKRLEEMRKKQEKKDRQKAEKEARKKKR